VTKVPNTPIALDSTIACLVVRSPADGPFSPARLTLPSLMSNLIRNGLANQNRSKIIRGFVGYVA